MELAQTERISLYKVLPGDRFRIIGRYATNSRYNYTKQQVFEKGHGLLSRTWEQNDRVNLDIAADYAIDPDQYRQEQCSTRISPTIADALTMKARSYSLFSIQDAAGTACIAVLVLESLSPHYLTKLDRRLKLDSIFNDETESATLRRFVEAAESEDDYLIQAQRVRVPS